MMTYTISTLHEKLNVLFKQGIGLLSPEESEPLIRELTAWKLQQPASLLTQIQQHIASRTTAQKDVEALVKILQVVSQAEIQLSQMDSVATGNLLETHHAVYVDPEELYDVAFGARTP